MGLVPCDLLQGLVAGTSPIVSADLKTDDMFCCITSNMKEES